MDKQEEYQQQARIIGEIYAQLGTTLSDKDREWLTSIFCLTAVLDDIVDSNKQESAPGIILGILELGIMSQSGDSLPSEDIKKLREHLLSLPDGGDAFTSFYPNSKDFIPPNKRVISYQNTICIFSCFYPRVKNVW